MAIIITELLITVKFDWELITKPLPPTITVCWIIGFGVLVAWTVWHFYLQRLLWHTEQVSRSASPVKHHLENNNTDLAAEDDLPEQTAMNGAALQNGNSPHRHLRSRAVKH